MVQVSKLMFEQTCRDVDCHLILHPWNESCLKSIAPLLLASTIGSAKFYSIVYAAQIAMRGKKMLRKEEWMKMGEYYLRSTLLGLLVTASAPTISCYIRKLLGGKFTYYTYLFVPFGLNGLFIYLEPPSRRGLVINLFCNLYIEYWLKTFQRAGYLSITKTQQTLMFMLGSSLLFYLMRLEGDKKERTPLFWLYTPEKVRRKSDNSKNVCPHEGACPKYVAKVCDFAMVGKNQQAKAVAGAVCDLFYCNRARFQCVTFPKVLAALLQGQDFASTKQKGYATYFGVGLGITLARLIIPKIRTPINAISSIRGKHFKLALFFGSYIGIYRAVVCYLCRKKGFDSALYALPAGYLAGLSFLFSPALGLSIASVTAALKLYSTILYDKKLLPTSIPLPELLYCLFQGTLFSARVLQPETCPSYVFNLMRTVSSGRSEMIAKNFAEIISRAQ